MRKFLALSMYILLILSLFPRVPFEFANEEAHNQLPIADAGGPYEAMEGETVVLNSSKSHDPDGDALQYRWDFDNDGIWDTNWSNTPTEKYIWGDDYHGKVKVEVTDRKGVEEWVKEEGVRVELNGTYTYYALSCNSDVITLPNSMYRMYYTQLYARSPSGAYYGNILSAISVDGLNWIKEGGVRVDYGGLYDTYETFAPDIVILSDGTYRMYYTGSMPGHYVILSAKSNDSMNWVKEGGIRINYDATYPGPSLPKVNKLTNGSYRMYYQGYNSLKGVTEILSAFSSDGMNWTLEGVRLTAGGPFDPIGAHTPDVILLPDKTFRMFYTGNDGSHLLILNAVSPDGLTWTKENRILLNYGGIHDIIVAAEPDIVVLPNGTMRMYYRGYDGSKSRILSALQIINYSTSTDIAPISVANVNPEVIMAKASKDIEVGLRVAGRKWNNVTIRFYEADNEILQLSIERKPGSPDEQIAWIPITLDLVNNYFAVITYEPEELLKGKKIGGNPVWLILKSGEGTEIRLHHTFNVQQSKQKNSEYWNHIEPWEVEINQLFIGNNITLLAHAVDQGSDDLIFDWSFGAYSIYFNNNLSSDSYPSPEGIFPYEATDVVTYIYSGSETITLVVRDDDGGNTTVILQLV